MPDEDKFGDGGEEEADAIMRLLELQRAQKEEDESGPDDDHSERGPSPAG